MLMYEIHIHILYFIFNCVYSIHLEKCIQLCLVVYVKWLNILNFNIISIFN